jgi:signal peptidase I
LELVKGGRRFRCRIDLATGQAALSISGPGAEQFHPTATTGVRGRGSHRIIFANADDQLLVWIDGSVVAFNSPTTYDSRLLEDCFPELADLQPAGIASRRAVLKISHLKLLRNIYYIASREASPLTDFTGRNPDLADPRTWRSFHNVQMVEFPLAADRFFVLGDNSAQSKDGRLWGSEYWVDRKLLIGKALFIYWPHSWDEVTIAGKDIPFPYFPNFKKMGFVR